MGTEDSALVIDSSSPCGRVGSSSAPSVSSRDDALLSVSRFRRKLGTEMSEIIPNLYLGSLRDAIDADQLKKHRIQYVVSVHDLTASHPAHDHLKVLKIQLSDCSSSDISSHFSTTNQFIHRARLQEAAVLVHCLAGVSRSATVVAAYLITVCDLSFLNALSLVSRKRPVINPNFGFRMQLCAFADGTGKIQHAAAERRRLREYFGATAFDAQLAVDRTATRSKIDWRSIDMALSQPSAHILPLREDRAAEHCTSSQINVPSLSISDSKSATEEKKPPPSSTTASAPLPIQKVIAQALSLPQTHRVQILTLVHNPILSDAHFIDE